MDKRILEAAHQSDPETMAKVAEALELIEDKEILADVFQDFEAVSSLTLEKCAAVPDAVRKRIVDTVTGGAALIGMAGAAALGTSLAAELYDAAKRGLTKDRNFKRIMKYDPKLKSDVVNPERIKPAFDALHRYAPDFTADPMLGASLLRSLANMPVGNEHQLITNLLSSRKALGEIKKNQFGADFRSKDKKDTFEQRKDLAASVKPPIEYHQHFHGGSKPKGNPVGMRTPGATPTND